MLQFWVWLAIAISMALIQHYDSNAPTWFWSIWVGLFSAIAGGCLVGWAWKKQDNSDAALEEMKAIAQQHIAENMRHKRGSPKEPKNV